MVLAMRLKTHYILVLLVFFMNTGGLCDVWEEVQPASNSFHVAADQEANPGLNPLTDDCVDHCSFQFQCQCHGNMMGNASMSMESSQPIPKLLISLRSRFLFSFEQSPPTRPPDV